MNHAVVDLFLQVALDPNNFERIRQLMGSVSGIHVEPLDEMLFWETLCSVNGYRLQVNRLMTHFRIVMLDGVIVVWAPRAMMHEAMKRVLLVSS